MSNTLYLARVIHYQKASHFTHPFVVCYFTILFPARYTLLIRFSFIQFTFLRYFVCVCMRSCEREVVRLGHILVW